MVRSLSFILWALESLWSVSSKWVIIWFAVAARQTTDDRGQEWKQTEHSGGKDGYDMDQKVALPIPFSTPSAWHSLGQSRSLVNISWVNKYLAKPTRLTPFWEVQEGWPKKMAEAWATHDVRAPAAVCSPEQPPQKAEWAVFSLTAQTVFLGPAASAAPVSLLELCDLRLHPGLTVSESVLQKDSRGDLCAHWSLRHAMSQHTANHMLVWSNTFHGSPWHRTKCKLLSLLISHYYCLPSMPATLNSLLL